MAGSDDGRSAVTVRPDTQPNGNLAEEREAIDRHLRAHAGRYWAGSGASATVSLSRMHERPAARLYWYRVNLASGPRSVVVKVPGNPADLGIEGSHGRPRLAAPPDLSNKYAREHQALELLDRHFNAVSDSRFGAVPILDHVKALRAIVMEEVVGAQMNRLFMRLGRLSPSRPSDLVRVAVENTGAWLREYHNLGIPETETRQPRRADVLDLVHRYCDHLEDRVQNPHFADLFQVVRAAANRALPDELPLGLNHGDFAMRNVVVGPEGRVSVFDTLALWRSPIYEDIAKFLLAMRFVRPQVYSHGLAFSETQLQVAEGWLLRGYFGDDPVPIASIRIYRLLLLLDKWSFELALPPQGSRLMQMVKLRLADAWFKAQARKLAAELG